MSFERIRTVKRAAAALGALLIAGATMAPAGASTTYEGAVKFGWTITNSFTAHIGTNFTSGAGSLTTGSGTIQTGGGAGVGTCPATSSGDTVATFSLSYGNISAGASATTGCNYKNAIGISVLTNDLNDFLVYETLDVTTLPTTYGVCAFADSTTLSTTTPTSLNTTAPAAATGTFGSALTCATPSGGGGAGSFINIAPGSVNNPATGGDVALTGAPPTGAYTTSAPTATAVFGTSPLVPASTTTTYFLGEDVQLNIPYTAASGSQTHAIILYFIPQ